MNFYLLNDDDVELLRSVIDIARNVDIQRHDDEHAARVLAKLEQPQGVLEAEHHTGNCPLCGTWVRPDGE